MPVRPRSPERVHAFDPGMRLIALLRDPIGLAYSHFQMELRWGSGDRHRSKRRSTTEAGFPVCSSGCIFNPGLGPSSGLGRSYVARGLFADPA